VLLLFNFKTVWKGLMALPIFSMKNLFFYIFLFCDFVINAQRVDSFGFYLPIPSHPYLQNKESVIELVNREKLDTSNNFFVADTSINYIFDQLGKFHEIWFFDTLGRRLRMYDGIKCVNNTLLCNSLVLADLKVDSTILISNLMSRLVPITDAKIDSEKYYAIIFWSISTGIKVEDSPFDWERILRRKYGNKINIVKISLDAFELWEPRTKNEILNMYQQIISILGTER